MGRRLGLVVGVNQYQDTTFQPLRFAENDARVFAQWLVNSRGGKWALNDVQYIQGIHATRDAIESLVLQLCLSVAQPDDLVVIYIASHAFIDERSGDGYLALTDTAYRDAKTGLHLLSLAQQIMPWSRANQIVFILDCFQTGQGWSARRTSPYDVLPLLGTSLLAGIQQHPNRVFLCSCRGNEFGMEAGERGLGLLMHSIIVGLSGAGTDPATGNVTLQNLYTYLISKLAKQQRPQIFGQAPAPIVLASGVVQQGQQQIVRTPPLATSQPMAVYTANTMQARQESPLLQGSYNATATAQILPSFQQQGRRQDMHSLEEERKQQSKLLLERASQAFKTQRIEEALRFTDQALQIVPDESAGLILKGQILGTMGRFPEALAIVDQARQKEPNNALIWSMGAVLLTNIGRHQEALTAIERSLELDASNPESYAIKTNIMASIAVTQTRNKTLPRNELIASEKKRSGPLSFFVAALFQFVSLLLGITGGVLAVLLPAIPAFVPLLLQSLGLTFLCVNAARYSYRYGFSRVLITLFFSLLAAGILGIGIGFRPVYTQLMLELQAHPAYMLPLFFLGAWLAVAAVLPVLIAIVAFIIGSVTRVRRNH